MFREPTEVEKTWTTGLISHKIEIFWDGDNVFYPGIVIRYDEEQLKHVVLYENDDTNQEYVEDLVNTTWNIWDETLTIPQVSLSCCLIVVSW